MKVTKSDVARESTKFLVHNRLSIYDLVVCRCNKANVCMCLCANGGFCFDLEFGVLICIR